MAADGGTYDPTDEWTDDRPEQDSLVEESSRASADTESRIDEGGSDEFADDRTLYDPADDVGEQSSLVPDRLEGQADLTGEEATEEPTYVEEGRDSEMPETIGPYWNRTVDSADTVAYWSNGVEAEYRPGDGVAVATIDEDEAIPLPVSTSDEFTEYLEENSPTDIRDRDDGPGADTSTDPGTTGDGGLYDPTAEVPAPDRFVEFREAGIDLDLAGIGTRDEIYDSRRMERHLDEEDTPEITEEDLENGLETVNGWELKDHNGTVQWRADGSPRAVDDAETILEVIQDGTGRWRVRRKVREEMGKPTGDQHTISERHHTRSEAIEAGREWMEDTPPSEFPAQTESTDDGDDEEAETDPRRAEKVQFGTLDAANQWRDDNDQHLHEADKRTTKTVSILPDAPESVIEDASTEATISTSQHKTYGQAKLSDRERDQLEDRDGWTWGQHGFQAMSAKALLQEEGGTPWIDYYDHTLEVDEHLSVVESAEDMAVMEGTRGPGEGRDDSEKSEAEIAEDLDRATGEACNHAEEGCRDGHNEACEVLLEDCGWTEEEIEQVIAAARDLGEEPTEVYDPTVERDTGQSFEEWAAEMAPDRPEEPEPDFEGPPLQEPTDEELRELAPVRPGEMTGPTMRALKKAWTGYKLARTEAREAHAEAEDYAQVINGIRVVNGQELLEFEEIEEWGGGQIVPEDPTEEFPVGDGSEEKSMAEAVEDGHAGGGFVQRTFAGSYDPTSEF